MTWETRDASGRRWRRGGGGWWQCYTGNDPVPRVGDPAWETMEPPREVLDQWRVWAWPGQLDRRADPSSNGHGKPAGGWPFADSSDHADVPPSTDEPAEIERLPVQQAGTKPDRPRPEVLVDNLIDAGELLVFGAARGIGKSWWAMDLSRQLATGSGRFMGTYTVRRAARVLYCHAEIDDWAAYDRWERLAGDSTIPGGLLESFEPWRIRIVRRRVTSTGDGVATSTEQVEAQLDPRLEQTIIAERIQVVVIDPWIGFYAGRENANDEAEMALATLRRLQLTHGVAIVIAHHFGKNDVARDPEDLWRGASRLADWASTRVTLVPYYTPAQAKEIGMTRLQARTYATVKILRRNHASPGEIAVKWNADSGAWDRWRAPEGSGDPKGPSPADVAAKCPQPDGWPSVLAASVALGISRDRTRALLEQARQQGLLEPFEGPRRAVGWRVPPPTGQATLGGTDVP